MEDIKIGSVYTREDFEKRLKIFERHVKATHVSNSVLV
jgi:hypothetical protein